MQLNKRPSSVPSFHASSSNSLPHESRCSCIKFIEAVHLSVHTPDMVPIDGFTAALRDGAAGCEEEKRQAEDKKFHDSKYIQMLFTSQLSFPATKLRPARPEATKSNHGKVDEKTPSWSQFSPTHCNRLAVISKTNPFLLLACCSQLTSQSTIRHLRIYMYIYIRK